MATQPGVTDAVGHARPHLTSPGTRSRQGLPEQHAAHLRRGRAAHRSGATALTPSRPRGPRQRRPIAVVADRDLIRALKPGVAARARDIAVEAVTIPDSASLSEAVMLLNRYDTTHLIAVDQAGGHPVGILSASDILAAYAATGSAT